jgi:hypothetical protein
MRLSEKLASVVFGSLILAGIVNHQVVNGQEAAPKAEAKAAKERAKPRGRLPAHYGAVIDESQREKLYGIQKTYQPQIEALQAQLAELRQKQIAEMEAVLTAEQKEKVKALAAAAKAKREKAAESKKNGDDAKSSEAAAPVPGAKSPETKAKKAS